MNGRKPRRSPIADVLMCVGMFVGLVVGLVAAWSLAWAVAGWVQIAVLGAATIFGMLGFGAVGDRIEFGVWWLTGRKS